VPVLTSSRRQFTAFIALIALCLAQSVAMAHALSHVGAREVPNAPGQHSQVCTDCVSHAPLLVTGGTAAIVFFLVFQAFSALRPRVARRPAGCVVHYAFRSRAPPR